MAKNAGSADWQGSLKKLEDMLQLYLVDKAPALPKQWKELIVSLSPWISVVMLVMLLPIILAAFGFSAFMLPFAYLGGLRMGMGYWVSWAISAVTLVLYALAVPGLFKRQKGAWNLMFYASLLTAVDNLISVNLAGLVVGTLISLYFLFQVKSYYK